MRVLRLALIAFPTAIVLLVVVLAGLAITGRVERTVEARGEIQVKSYQVVRPQVSGFVRDVLAAPGDQVEAGDVLLRIEDPRFQLQLAEARRRLLEVQAELDKCRLEQERGQQQAHPLERSRQRDAILRSELDARVSRSLRREAELFVEATRQRLDQLQQLHDEGLVSDQRLREGEQEVRVAEERAAQRAIEEQRAYDVIPDGQRALELLVVEQEGNRLELETRARRLEAELELWTHELRRLEALEELQTLRANLAGVVIGEPHNDLLGRYLAPGEEIFQVIDPESIRFVSQVPEEAMVRVRSGQQAQIELLGLPKNQFETFSGRVERVSQLAVVEAGSPPGYSVDVHLDRPWITLAEGPFLLRGGMRGVAQIAYRHDVPALHVFYEFLTGKPQVPDAPPQQPPQQRAVPRVGP